MPEREKETDMLNEEKIRLMTGIAMFEKKMMKESIPATRYFKSDYVGSHLIRSFIAYSLTVCLCLMLWVLYRFDDLINAMAVDDLLSLCARLVFYYVAGLLAYLVVTWKIYSRRYDEAVGKLKIYQAKLRRLDKKYNQQGVKENGEEKSK